MLRAAKVIQHIVLRWQHAHNIKLFFLCGFAIDCYWRQEISTYSAAALPSFPSSSWDQVEALASSYKRRIGACQERNPLLLETLWEGYGFPELNLANGSSPGDSRDSMLEL